MAKTAVVILASTETHEGLGRAVNGLELAKESQEHGDEMTVVFDGGGTVAAADLADPEHRAHGLFQSVQGSTGACSFCASAFGVKERIQQAGIPLLAEYDNHPSLRKLRSEGYEIITF